MFNGNGKVVSNSNSYYLTPG